MTSEPAAPDDAHVVDRWQPHDRAWVEEAISKVEADANRSADTHLLVLPLPQDWGIDVYLKHESTHPTGGHFLDQFTYAERATDWRGNNNIAESIFEQLARERHPVPQWIVVGAGTGGTSATLGRYVRYQRHGTRVCVVDPERSALFPGGSTETHPRRPSCRRGSKASAGHAWSRRSCRRSPTARCACRTPPRSPRCAWYYDDRWLEDQALDLAPYEALLTRFWATGEWHEP